MTYSTFEGFGFATLVIGIIRFRLNFWTGSPLMMRSGELFCEERLLNVILLLSPSKTMGPVEAFSDI